MNILWKKLWSLIVEHPIWQVRWHQHEYISHPADSRYHTRPQIRGWIYPPLIYSSFSKSCSQKLQVCHSTAIAVLLCIQVQPIIQKRLQRPTRWKSEVEWFRRKNPLGIKGQWIAPEHPIQTSNIKCCGVLSNIYKTPYGHKATQYLFICTREPTVALHGTYGFWTQNCTDPLATERPLQYFLTRNRWLHSSFINISLKAATCDCPSPSERAWSTLINLPGVGDDWSLLPSRDLCPAIICSTLLVYGSSERTRLQQQYTANLGNSTIFEPKHKSTRGRNHSHIYPPTPIYAAIQTLSSEDTCWKMLKPNFHSKELVWFLTGRWPQIEGNLLLIYARMSPM